MQLDELLSILKEKGCRMTPQRKIIIDLLIKRLDTLSRVDDLLGEAKLSNPAINATTIYRNLELLDDLGLLHIHNDNDGSKLYKLICHKAHHHHIICKSCGKILPIDYCPITPELKAIIAKESFTLEEHHLELYGTCKDCRSKLSFPPLKGGSIID